MVSHRLTGTSASQRVPFSGQAKVLSRASTFSFISCWEVEIALLRTAPAMCRPKPPCCLVVRVSMDGVYMLRVLQRGFSVNVHPRPLGLFISRRWGQQLPRRSFPQDPVSGLAVKSKHPESRDASNCPSYCFPRNHIWRDSYLCPNANPVC